MYLFFTRRIQVLMDQALFSGSSFILNILIARCFSATEFGIYSTYVLFTYLAISIVSAWTLQIFQVAANSSKEYVSFVFWIQVFLGCIGAILAIILSSLYFTADLVIPIFFGLGFLMYDFGRKILLALDKIPSALLLDAYVGITIMSSFHYFLNGDERDLHVMVGYFTYVYLSSMCLLLVFLKPFYFSKPQWMDYLKTHVNQGKWLFLSALSQWWAGNLYVVASGLYLGASALGALRLAQSIFGILNLILQTFENYILPQVAINVSRDIFLGIDYLKRISQRSACIFIPVILLIFVFSSPIISFFGGQKYVSYAFVLRGLSVLYLFVFLSQPIRFLFRALHLNQHFFYAYLLSLIFALSSADIFLSHWGLIGAILGLISSQIILLFYWIIILQYKNIKFWKLFISY